MRDIRERQGKAAHLHRLKVGGGAVALLHPVEDVLALLLRVGRRIVAQLALVELCRDGGAALDPALLYDVAAGAQRQPESDRGLRSSLSRADGLNRGGHVGGIECRRTGGESLDDCPSELLRIPRGFKYRPLCLKNESLS